MLVPGFAPPLILILAQSLVAQGAEVERIGAVDPDLLGIWRQIDSSVATDTEGNFVEITEDFWSVVSQGQLQFRAPVIGQSGDRLIISLFCNRQPRRVSIRTDEERGDILSVSFTETRTRFNPEPKAIAERFIRESQRPAAFDLQRVPLGNAVEVPTTRLAEIRTQLTRRAEEDRSARQVFATPGAQPTQEDQQRMLRVDRDNTTWLEEVISEVGWIDEERFGKEAAEAAWLIVQHTQDLPLKWTVLQILQEAIEDGAEADQEFALLWDRTQIWLGQKQRYGSQIFQGPEGMFVAPLEDPSSVDERRSQLGMTPLASYLELFLDRSERRSIAIRTEF